VFPCFRAELVAGDRGSRANAAAIPASEFTEAVTTATKHTGSECASTSHATTSGTGGTGTGGSSTCGNSGAAIRWRTERSHARRTDLPFGGLSDFV
jgi:hypothetical protein